MQNKYLIENIFLTKSYLLDQEVLLNNKLIKKYINIFWNDIMIHIHKDQIVLLLFRVRLGDEHDHTVFGSYFSRLI
jgi:hypothetical protein